MTAAAPQAPGSAAFGNAVGRGRASPTFAVPLAVAAVTAAVLAVLSGRYGYHRDELYFVAAGRHLAWGYPDQPPLVPVLARAMTALAPESLVVLRLPSTLIAAVVVALAGATARRLGAGPLGQLVASAGTALCGFVLATGHLLSTSTAALAGTAAFLYVVARILLGADRRLWLVAGLLAGVTVQANPFPAVVFAAVALGLVLLGPRAALRGPWPYIAGVLAAGSAAPYVAWQSAHGWPQLEVARQISSGGSASSVGRALFLPMEALQAGPALALLWLPGLVVLLRDRRLRALGFAFLAVQAVVLVMGGKPYYVSGFFPLLIAAGAQPMLDRSRRALPAVLLVLSIPGILITLPVLPAADADLAVAANPDAGETIGWPEFAQQVAAAYRRMPAPASLLAENYGEAGAVERFGPALGLPRPHSGHNAYWLWGPPPAAVPVLTVGMRESSLRTICRDIRPAGRISLPSDIDNEENGAPLFMCTPNDDWRVLWPSLKRLG